MSTRQPRLEWISLVYLAFFVLAVFAPSIFRRGYLGLSATLLQELTIFAFGIAGLMTFTLYEKAMERREQEREQERLDYHRAKNELIESYTYIGSINRKIELLKKLANDTSFQMQDTNKKISKDLFQALAANACAACGAQAALLRFVDLEKMRTDKEFIHRTNESAVFKVPNRELASIREKGMSHASVRAEDGHDILVVPSDHSGPTPKAHLMLWLDNQGGVAEIDTSLLKVFVNQAEMLYRNLPAAMQEASIMDTATSREDDEDAELSGQSG